MEQNGIWDTLPNELYVIGDIHGDFYALKQALELTECITFDSYDTSEIVKEFGESIKLIDGCEYYINNMDKIRWNPTKRNCKIVFAGDLIDRCRNTTNRCQFIVHDEDCDYYILKILIELNIKALEYNSNVIIVLGNHEIMNLENKLNYISRKAHDNNNRLLNIQDILKSNLNNLYGIIRINNYIICHGGINPNFLNKYQKHFNSSEEFIANYNFHVRKYLFDNSYELSFLLKDNESPFWDRTNGLNNNNEACQLDNNQCHKIFKNNILNIKQPIDSIKLIVAHCPQVINNMDKGINLINCGDYINKIWRVDIAMSRAFDNYHELNIISEFLKNLNNTNIDLNYILQFNITRQNNQVQILKITNNNSDDIIFESSSSEEFSDEKVISKKHISKKIISKKAMSKKVITEEIIVGKTSLEYFYTDVFKTDYKLMLLYLLHDIELYYDIEDTHNIPILKKKVFYSHYKKSLHLQYLTYTVYNN